MNNEANEFDELSTKIKRVLNIDALRAEDGGIYINSGLINGILDKIENLEERIKDLEWK